MESRAARLEVALASVTAGVIIAGCGTGQAPSRPQEESTGQPGPTATAPATQPKVDQAQARDIAQKAVPGGQVHTVEIADENGRSVWDADTVDAQGNPRDVDIDAETGQVMRNEPGGADQGDNGQGGNDRGGNGDG